MYPHRLEIYDADFSCHDVAEIMHAHFILCAKTEPVLFLTGMLVMESRGFILFDSEYSIEAINRTVGNLLGYISFAILHENAPSYFAPIQT